MIARGHFLLGLILLVLMPLSRADEVVLKDGRTFEGKIEKETKTEVVMRTRFGVMTFAMAEVVSLARGKTKAEIFEERWQAAKTAQEYYELGQWSQEAKLKSEAKRAMKRAIEIDGEHEAARLWLGYVRHEGKWVTPEEREVLLRAAEDAQKAAQGLVRHGDQWVSAEEKQKLDAGLVLVDGRWLSFDDAQRARGFELWRGEWLPRERALSQQDVDRAEERAGSTLLRVSGTYCLLAGAWPESFMQPIADGIDRGRLWFHECFGLALGDTFVGDRTPQFYLWNRDSTPYVETCTWFASLTPTVTAGWADAVKKIHGFVWWDPYCLSSARLWNRPDEDLGGHCYHHSGHLLLNRLGYDGRLLPPWYDEGFAALLEYETHQRNAVFCVANAAAASSAGGTSVKKVEFQFESQDFRRGSWRKRLLQALQAGEVPSFDKLAQKEFGGLTQLDIASSMAILEWLLQSEGAIARFHAVLRELAPAQPGRVILDGNARQAAYDRAFQAAVQLPWRGADQAWRAWFPQAE